MRIIAFGVRGFFKKWRVSVVQQILILIVIQLCGCAHLFFPDPTIVDVERGYAQWRRRDPIGWLRERYNVDPGTEDDMLCYFEHEPMRQDGVERVKQELRWVAEQLSEFEGNLRKKAPSRELVEDYIKKYVKLADSINYPITEDGKPKIITEIKALNKAWNRDLDETIPDSDFRPYLSLLLREKGTR